MRDELTKQLRLDEGEKLSAYPDHLGYWTIGVGRLIDARKNGGISRGESAYLLNNDIDKVESELLRRIPWFYDLDEVRRAALINMGFQLGVDGLLHFTRSLQMIRDGNFQVVEENLLKSLWAKQTPERARRVAKQMGTGIWQFAT